MRMHRTACFLFAAAFSLLMGADSFAAGPKCEKQAEALVAGALKAKVLKGSFFDSPPLIDVRRANLPTGEEEVMEVITYSNSRGDNRVVVTLSIGLCELRSLVHELPL